jgi:hypothetical protein
VELVSLRNVSESPARKLALHDTIQDRDRDAVLPVVGVKMWRHVVSVVHGDHYPEKAAELRHSSSLPRLVGTPT